MICDGEFEDALFLEFGMDDEGETSLRFPKNGSLSSERLASYRVTGLVLALPAKVFRLE